MTETTQEERDHMRNFTGDSPEAFITKKLIHDADRLARIDDDYKNALAMIRMRGVPEQRAVRLTHALDVLLTRLDKEVSALRESLARLEAGVRALADELETGYGTHLHPASGVRQAYDAGCRDAAERLRALLDRPARGPDEG